MSLRIWLPLDGDLRNQGCTNMEFTNSNAVINTSGKIGSCYSFNGSNAQIYAVHDKSIWNDKPISVCMWYKFVAGNTTNCVVDIAADLCLSYVQNSSGLRFSYWRAYSNSSGTRTGDSNTISNYYDVNSWHHVVYVADHNLNQIYVDGILASSFDSASKYTTNFKPLLGSSYNRITVGKSAGSSPFASGLVNDVRIYDHALSAAEVREIAQGLVLHYKLDGSFGGAGENLVINGDARNGLTGWSNWGTASSRQVITINNKKWFTFKTDANGNYGGFSQDRGIALYKPNTQYTISALMYASTNASGRLWVHTRSTEGGANLAQYLTTVNVTTSPALYTFTFNTGTNASYTINKLNLMIGAVNTTSALDFYISNIKVEEGPKATTWVPCQEESGYDTTKIEDNSGYNHNAISNGSQPISIDIDTPKYSYSTKFISGSRIAMPVASSTCLPTDAITVSIWYKSFAGTARFLSCTEGGGWNFEVNSSKASFPFYIKGKGYGRVIATQNFYSDNIWHMITASYDGVSTAKIYLDGQLDNTATITSGWENIPLSYATSTPLTLGAEAQTIASPIAGTYVGNLSDLRIYCTALSDDAVLELYHTGAKIDNKANLHTYEINEHDANKLTKTGIMYDNMVESIMTLPDGSHWQLLMFHYVDDGKNLFTSANASNCNNFGLFSRLKDIDGFKIGNQYEFYAIQDGAAYRWIQTNAPLTTTSVAGFSAVSGYTSPGAGICKCAGNTLLARTNSTGNWWNAMGCYTIYNNGIPGFNSVVCKKYIALYARIPNADAKLSNQTANSFEFIEL